jgi:quercetin dioxygenase-like cupin family protein
MIPKKNPRFSPRLSHPPPLKLSPCRTKHYQCGEEEKPMMTISGPSTGGQLVPSEPDTVLPALQAVVNRRSRRSLWGLAAAGLVAGALVFSQVSPLQIIPLAEGHNPDNNVVLHLKGTTDVLQTDLIFQPGGTTGWHYHPGPVVVVIKSGALTEIDHDGCMTVHPAGSAFFEDPNVVHNVINQTGVVTEVYATFLSPAGSQPLIPASDPGGVCRSGHDHDHDH